MLNVDGQFQAAMRNTLTNGVETAGRTVTNRIRLLTGVTTTYDCSDGMMSAFTLRKNNPNLAIAETMAFLMGAEKVSELIQAHPALKLWEAWAGDKQYLGGVYGREFMSAYPRIIKRLIEDPLSTHHRMTTLIPRSYPIPGCTYTENVDAGRFSLMPCLHSYHFLSDGENLFLHATQASGDMPVGVFPHNAYQVQFMLLLTAHLTGLKPVQVVHHIHDAHIYKNQVPEVRVMLGRDSLGERIPVSFDKSMHLSRFTIENLKNIRSWIETAPFSTHPPITIAVDS